MKGFEAVASAIGKQAMSKDGATLHVGDFLYSLKEKGHESWEAWENEFFLPGDTLFSKTPFIFVRGNHEDCGAVKKGYRGWFYFFGPKAGSMEGMTPEDCKKTSKISDAYYLDYGRTILAILDSSSAPSFDESETKILTEQLKKLNHDIETTEDIQKNEAMIATHCPFWGASISDPKSGKKPGKQTLALQNAYDQFMKQSPNSHFRHVISGHRHLFDILKFKDPTINQLIVGNGGVELDVGHEHSHFDHLAFDGTPEDRGLLLHGERNTNPQSSILEHGFVKISVGAKKEDMHKIQYCNTKNHCEHFYIGNCPPDQTLEKRGSDTSLQCHKSK